jgi:hypothetical protein
MKLEFSWQILELFLNFMEICPVPGVLLHAGGRADMTKLLVVFRNFAKELNNPLISPQFLIFHFPVGFPTKILQAFLFFPFSVYVCVILDL